MDAAVKWTHLHPKQIAKQLYVNHGIKIGKKTIKRLLKKHGFRRRKMQKCLATSTYERRDEQFKIIFYFITLLNSTNGAIISIDTKKKEQLGNYIEPINVIVKRQLKSLTMIILI